MLNCIPDVAEESSPVKLGGRGMAKFCKWQCICHMPKSVKRRKEEDRSSFSHKIGVG